MDETGNTTGSTVYTYQTAGTYTVTCTAVDNNGDTTTSQPLQINVSSTSGTGGGSSESGGGGGGGCSLSITGYSQGMDLGLLIPALLWLVYLRKSRRR